MELALVLLVVSMSGLLGLLVLRVFETEQQLRQIAAEVKRIADVFEERGDE